MADDRETAEKILLYTGGVENVMQAAHCATRLRLVLRDPKKVREAELKDLPLVKGMIESGGQFQIILGTGIVNKVYKEFTALAGEGAGESLEKGAGDGTGNGAQIKAKGGNGIQRISRMFGDIFLPVIPVIVASGILMGVRSFLTGSGLMVTDSNWYNIMAILIDTGFSFLPALICYSAAKKFGGSPILGFVLGLMVISSTLPAAGAVGKGNAEPMLIQLLGITFKLTGFQGSVLVAIVGGWLTAKIENMCRRFVPNVFDIILTPILTLGISLFVILFGVGPVIHVVEAGVVTSFFCFAKDKKLKALAGSSSIAAWFGITEPAIFGITLPYSVTFVLGCIGSAFGGLFSALMHLSATGMGVSAIPGYLLFLNGGAVEYTLVCLISAGISFVLTAVYIKKKGI